jgi:hypothetical protein
MQHIRSAGLAAGLVVVALVTAAPTVAAGPANVTMRIEGVPSTVLEESGLRTTLTPVNKSGKPGEECTGTSVAGALEQAIAGDWGGNWFAGFGYSVERIRQESHPFDDPNGDYWTFWVNDRFSQTGICQTELQEGDSVLFFVDRCVYDPVKQECSNDPVLPLELRAPANGRTDVAAEVTVVSHDGKGGTALVKDARVTGPGVDAVTDGDGRAAVRFGQAGRVRLKAAKAGYARSAAEEVCVAAGADGTCGTSATPQPVAAPDKLAPVTLISGIRDGQRFARKRAPRALRGSVRPDPSGLRAVKLSLTRSRGGECSWWSRTRERFRGTQCGRRAYFRIGDREQWSYLLPRRLRPGRYVLDAVAIDKAGNRDPLVRGRNRVVFLVR